MKAENFFSLLKTLIFLCLFSVIPVFGQETDSSKKINQAGIAENKLTQNKNSARVNDPDNSARDFEDVYRVGYKDTLDVQVFRHPQVSGHVSVNPNGTIILPRLKAPIVAVCKTERELAEEIAAEYRKDYLRDPFVTVKAVEKKSQTLSVIGAVEKPGYFYADRRYHLLELLALAGGPSEDAGTQLLIARTGSTSHCQDQNEQKNNDNPEIELLTFRIRDVSEGKQILWMKPGDVVSVLKADPFYVYGNVEKPGMYYLNSPTTLLQAIATAEGFKPAYKGSIKILRQKANSTEREELVFKLKDIENKKIADPLLQPNDIVAVSEDKIQSILNGVVKAITGGLGNVPLILRP